MAPPPASGDWSWRGVEGGTVDADIKHPTTAAEWAAQLLARLAGQANFSPDDLAVLQTQAAALTRPAAAACATDPTVPQVLRRREELPALADRLAAATAVAIDLETSSLDPRQGEFVGIGLAVPDGAYYLPTGHRLAATDTLLADQLMPAEVASALGLEGRPLVAHNAKFEFKWLRAHAGFTPRFVWDTLLAARLLRADLPAGLKEVAVRELDVPDWGLAKQEMSKIAYLPVDRVARYCAKDVWYTLELMRRQTECRT